MALLPPILPITPQVAAPFILEPPTQILNLNLNLDLNAPKQIQQDSKNFFTQDSKERLYKIKKKPKKKRIPPSSKIPRNKRAAPVLAPCQIRGAKANVCTDFKRNLRSEIPLDALRCDFTDSKPYCFDELHSGQTPSRLTRSYDRYDFVSLEGCDDSPRLEFAYDNGQTYNNTCSDLGYTKEECFTAAPTTEPKTSKTTYKPTTKPKPTDTTTKPKPTDTTTITKETTTKPTTLRNEPLLQPKQQNIFKWAFGVAVSIAGILGITSIVSWCVSVFLCCKEYKRKKQTIKFRMSTIREIEMQQSELYAERKRQEEDYVEVFDPYIEMKTAHEQKRPQ